MADVFRHFSDDIRLLNPNLFNQLGIKTHAVVDSDHTIPLRELNSAVAMDVKEERRSKFGNKRTKVGDLTFDSRAEANRYLVLKAQEDAGEIKGLMTQVRINLLQGFTYKGEKVRAIWYTADFVWMVGEITYVEDLKSAPTSKTKDFRLRWRLLQYLYKDRDDVICQLTVT